MHDNHNHNHDHHHDGPHHHHEPRPVTFTECVRFHGHSCPGLASGYRAATAAMEALGVKRPEDEELVAICETDACGVDAIQVIAGTTAGKGNQMFFKAQLRPSPVRAYNEDPELAAENPFWTVFIYNAAHTVPIKNVPVQAEIDRIITDMTDEALLHKKTPQEAVSGAAAQIQAILDEYWAGK